MATCGVRGCSYPIVAHTRRPPSERSANSSVFGQLSPEHILLSGFEAKLQLPHHDVLRAKSMSLSPSRWTDAPELAGRISINLCEAFSADVWGLGVIALLILSSSRRDESGEVPKLTGKPHALEELVATLPAELRQTVVALLNPEPRCRPSAAAVASRLASLYSKLAAQADDERSDGLAMAADSVPEMLLPCPAHANPLPEMACRYKSGPWTVAPLAPPECPVTAPGYTPCLGWDGLRLPLGQLTEAVQQALSQCAVDFCFDRRRFRFAVRHSAWVRYLEARGSDSDSSEDDLDASLAETSTPELNGDRLRVEKVDALVVAIYSAEPLHHHHPDTASAHPPPAIEEPSRPRPRQRPSYHVEVRRGTAGRVGFARFFETLCASLTEALALALRDQLVLDSPLVCCTSQARSLRAIAGSASPGAHDASTSCRPTRCRRSSSCPPAVRTSVRPPDEAAAALSGRRRDTYSLSELMGIDDDIQKLRERVLSGKTPDPPPGFKRRSDRHHWHTSAATRPRVGESRPSQSRSHLTAVHTSHLTPHTSHLTPHTSRLTPHTSRLTPHASRLTPHSRSHLAPRR